MNQISSAAVLFALLLIPTGVFLIVRATVERIPWRVCLALLIAVIAGGASYYLAVHHAWRPTFKGGGRLNLNPLHLAVAHSIILLAVFAVIQFRLGRVSPKK
jgi:hypothetical protein